MSKTELVRTPSKASGGITEGERTQLQDHADMWIQRILRTDAIEPDKIGSAIRSLYKAAGLKEPRVVIVPSPMVMAFAYGAAAWIWYCREHKSVIRAATDDATSAATRNATRNATRAATRAATDDATSAATRDATDAATRAATWGATDDATRAATRAATWGATWGATSAATWGATDAATWDATDAATSAATDAAKACFDLAGRGGVECAKNWHRVYQGGNMWGQYDSYLTAFRGVIGLRLPEHDRYAAWEACAINGGFRVMHKEFCIVSDFPLFLKKDEANRPHCDDGPSHMWRDGWALWYIHGVVVTEQIVLRPETLTVEQIREEPNAEVRRIMLDRFGVSRYIKESGARVVCEYGGDHPLKGLRTARLMRVDVKDDEPIIMLDMLNSTPESDGSTKRYWIRIDPAAYGGRASSDCLAAMASTYRLPNGDLLFRRPRDYQPLVET